MPIDPSIALGVKQPQFESPVNALSNILQMRQAEQQNQLGQLKMQEYQQGVDEKNRLRSIYGTWNAGTTDDQRAASLKNGGFFTQADALDKTQIERQKAKAETDAKAIETAKKRVDLAGSAFNYVRQNPTLENAMAVLDHLGVQGIYSPEQVAQYKAKVQADPANIGQMADIAFRGALDAKEQLAKIETRNIGGSTQTMSTDPVTLQQSVVGSVQNTQSPDSVASNATSVENNKRTVGATIRGQDLVDKRSVETQGNAATTYDPERGIIVNRNTGESKPVTAGGQPVAPKPDQAAKKELMSINQQRSILNGALNAVTVTPSAFSMGRGVAGKLPFGESIAGRTETDKETQARAYVFNNVSRVINERAGAAQSAQELARLNTFLPADTDNPKQIKNKIIGFQHYLDDLEKGTVGSPTSVKPNASGKASGFTIINVE